MKTKVARVGNHIVQNVTAASMINDIIAFQNKLSAVPWEYPDNFVFSMDDGYHKIPGNTTVSYYIGKMLDVVSVYYDYKKYYSDKLACECFDFTITEEGKRWRAKKLSEYEEKQKQKNLKETKLLTHE